jgi:hypothetical protein
MIEERIDDDRHAIVDVQIGVARELRRDDVARRAIVADDADVEGVGVVQDAHLGFFGRRRGFERLALEQRADRRRARPRRFVQTAVDPDRLRDPDRGRARGGWRVCDVREEREQD